jgi:hypothetical protein
MRDLLLVPIHLLAALTKLLGPGGACQQLNRSFKYQLLISDRARKRAPNLTMAFKYASSSSLALDARATRRRILSWSGLACAGRPHCRSLFRTPIAA